MNAHKYQQIRELIPTIIATDYIDINTKRMNFIFGQGAIVYDNTFAVEIYVPRNPVGDLTFFAVDRHFGNIQNIGQYYRRLPVYHIDDPKVTDKMKTQFEEALFANFFDKANVKALYDNSETRKVA